MKVEQLTSRLWRWTGLHPDWRPEHGGPDGWEQEVASYALVGGDELVLFDPLVPAAEEGRFWRALDEDVRRHGPPRILLTVYWHARSAREIAARYAGTQVFSVGRAPESAPGAVVFAPGEPLPAGVEARPTLDPDEVVFWLPSERALVAGDVLLGSAANGVRVMPDAWLREGTTREQVRDALRPLLELPVELVLLTHGGAVGDGRAALTAVLG